MSRLIDELNRMAKGVPQPIGFKAARTTASATRILLIGSFAQTAGAGLLAGSVEGADAVLVRLSRTNLAAKALQKTAESLPDIPWGAWLEDIGNKKVETLVEAGCDFVVFPPASRLSAIPKNEKLGKIIQVESSLGEGLLRAVNDIPVDAVFLTDVKAGDSIAWHHLMMFRRLANLLTKPLLVSVALSVSGGELEALWEAGVDGVVVETEAGEPEGKLKALRQTINELTFRPSRKRRKEGALLPRI
ncbi:MAG: hypothetical protein A2144_12130, partial [Chloroflexi bacterium RBG_16_50_9]